MVLAGHQTKYEALPDYIGHTSMERGLHHLLGEYCYPQWTNERRPTEAVGFDKGWTSEGHEPYSSQMSWTKDCSLSAILSGLAPEPQGHLPGPVGQIIMQ